MEIIAKYIYGSADSIDEIMGQCVLVCNPTYLEQSKSTDISELKNQCHANTKYRPIKGRRNI